MNIIAATPPPPEFFENDYRKWFAVGAAYCGKCVFPYGFKILPMNIIDIPKQNQRLTEALQRNADVEHAGYVVELRFIEAPRAALEHLPERVERALRQAEVNFDRAGCEEPAAVFYGRAIELALKESHPEVSGTLASRIKTLAKDRIIPQAMADWADEVRVVRNDGAHDDGVTRDEVAAARDFADAFLRYLITLPRMVEERRARTAKGADG